MLNNKEFILIFLTAISSFGTFIASLISLLNFIEIRKQRIQSSSPSLILGNINIFLYYFPGRNQKFSFSSVELHLEEDSIEIGNNDKKNIEILLPIINLGSPAKDVSIEWNFNFGKIIDEIQRIDTNKIFRIELKKHLLEIESDSFGIKLLLSIRNDFQANRSFIVPSYDSNYPQAKIRLPYGYQMLYSIYFSLLFDFYNLQFSKNSELKNYSNSFSKIICSLNYEDIHGNKFQSINNLAIDFAAVTHPNLISNKIQKIGNFELTSKKRNDA